MRADPVPYPEQSMKQNMFIKVFVVQVFVQQKDKDSGLSALLWQCGSGSRRAKSMRIQFCIRNNLLTKKYLLK
jgi:hypothetical protein